jgi:anti-anti-sigma regulatory factor
MLNTDEPYVFQAAGLLYSNKDRERLHRELEERIVVDGVRRVVLDFSATGWFGAPILDEIVVAAEMLHSQGGELLLVGSSKIHRMITAARADRVKMFANVQSALASFGRPVCAAA